MTTFTITRVRDMDGTPFDVADRAVAQVQALTELLHDALSDADVAARNAQMSRNLLMDPNDAGGDHWIDNVVKKKIDRIGDDLRRAKSVLGHVRLAAGFDPKHPPKE